MGLWFKKPRKTLGAHELEDLIIESDTKRVDFEIKTEKTLSEIAEQIKKLHLIKEIPEKWLSVCKKLNANFPEIGIETIYKILKGYKSMLAEEKTLNERAINNLAESKKKAEAEEIHNCYMCNAALKEGEYYKVGNKYACLKHLGKDQTKLKGVKKDGTNQNLL